jgi:hypothetical protein
MEYKDIENLDPKGLVKGIYDYQGMRISDPMFAELIRKETSSIKELRDSIEKLDKTTTKYSSYLIWLTVVIAVLTLIMTVATVISLKGAG